MRVFGFAIAATACGLIATAAIAHEGGHGAQTLVPAAQYRPLKLSTGKREWLAGDHHVHSEFSADYEPNAADPSAVPTPLFGKDGRYSIQKNAEMAHRFGLSWMVSTDHGGPGHSRINHDIAYPALLVARTAVPDLLLFFGMELDTPAGDHSSLIIPRSDAERGQLREIEANWSQREAWPLDPAWDKPERMIGALKVMQAQPLPPVLFANHPSRSAESETQYGRYDPGEFRDWNDVAPTVAVGMEGAPGHQAGALHPDGSLDPAGRRGGYRKIATMGGFDPMTARLGGLWDAMLTEGRRWWITATSDSHRHWREGGSDFWPGEYSKTYVKARHDYGDVIDGLRKGRIFVATGDLVSQVDVTATGSRTHRSAGLGEDLLARRGDDVTVVIRVRDPKAANGGGFDPQLARIDLISGPITGQTANRAADRGPRTQVLKRFTASDWQSNGEVVTVRYQLKNIREPLYLRVRGTNTSELEPSADPAGEDPWSDLWFYANPIFVKLER